MYKYLCYAFDSFCHMIKRSAKSVLLFAFGVTMVFAAVFQWNNFEGSANGEDAITAALQTTTPTERLSPTPTIFVTPSTSVTPTVVQQITQAGNPLAGANLFNDQDTNSAAKQVQEWQASRPADAELLKKIADQPKAIWLGNWNSNIQGDTQNIVNKAVAANAVPVFIAYNIPGRDCGNYSAGGAGNAQAYKDWINSIANGIGGNKAAVVLEPDALAQDCLQGAQKQERIDLLKYAIATLKGKGNTAVYLDAGHSAWIAADQISERLRDSGVEEADGFALNVSNFETTDASIAYGQTVSFLVGGKHFVIDTSRNGNGPSPDIQWCNPAGRALGDKPTTNTGNSLLDGKLWLKYPGQSDGNCNGAPNAGEWFADYALELAKNAKW